MLTHKYFKGIVVNHIDINHMINITVSALKYTLSVSRWFDIYYNMVIKGITIDTLHPATQGASVSSTHLDKLILPPNCVITS